MRGRCRPLKNYVSSFLLLSSPKCIAKIRSVVTKCTDALRQWKKKALHNKIFYRGNTMSTDMLNGIAEKSMSNLLHTSCESDLQ